MAIPETLEYYILQAILNYVEAQLPTVTFQFRGLSNDNTIGLEEWVAVTNLNMPRRPSQKDVWKGVGLFQFSCFSRFAEGRADGLADAPYKLAGKVAMKIEAATIEVTEIDQNPQTKRGALMFHEQIRMEHIDEEQLKIAATGDFDPSGIHAVVMDFPWSYAQKF